MPIGVFSCLIIALSINRTLTRPAATLSHRMGEGLGVRALLSASLWSQFACIRRLKLSTSRVLLRLNAIGAIYFRGPDGHSLEFIYFNMRR